MNTFLSLLAVCVGAVAAQVAVDTTTAPPTPTPTPTPTPINFPTAPPKNYTAAFQGRVQPYGAMTQVAVGPMTVEDLMIAMGTRSNYAASVGRPICIVEVKKVSAQMVNGINYLFEAEGCSQTFTDTLGVCSADTCIEPALWQITAFVQPWNNTYRVEKIKFLS